MPRQLIDITGQRFGRLLVQSRDGTNSRRWLCLCDCGTQKIVSADNLRSKTKGATRSCGCQRKDKARETSSKRRGDLSGQRFNRLVVLALSTNKQFEQALWLCLCDCGNEQEATAYNLRNNLVVSCGCQKRENAANQGRCNAIDIEGQRFGRLRVIRRDHVDVGWHWLCLCDCGRETVADMRDLRDRRTTSCGCYQRQLAAMTIAKMIDERKWAELTQQLPNEIDLTLYQGRLEC